MFADIVIPKNNEAEFIGIASRLGIKKLYFLYDFDEKNKFEADFESKTTAGIGFIATNKDSGRALKLSRLVAAKSSPDDRFFIESRKATLIYGFEELPRRDHMHQRASGLNQVLCELARKNNIAIGFSYSSLLSKNSMPALMGRMSQNIKLCQKYKVKTVIASFSGNPCHLRSPYDIASLFSMLGMERKKINESMDFGFY